MRTSDPLALLYNDRSPMENHHCSASWALLREYNFLGSKIPFKVRGNHHCSASWTLLRKNIFLGSKIPFKVRGNHHCSASWALLREYNFLGSKIPFKVRGNHHCSASWALFRKYNFLGSQIPSKVGPPSSLGSGPTGPISRQISVVKSCGWGLEGCRQSLWYLPLLATVPCHVGSRSRCSSICKFAQWVPYLF